MVRKLLVSSAVALATLALSGVPNAGAVTLPAGDGTVSCGIAGTVKVARPLATPDSWKVVVSGKIGGCTYNGLPIPFSVTGATRTVAVNNPTAVCAALADGTVSARTAVTIKVNSTLYASATVNVNLDVAPSAPGSLVSVGGSGTIKGIGVDAGVTAQTDRPLVDLCHGATKVLYLGTAHLSWDRP